MVGRGSLPGSVGLHWSGARWPRAKSNKEGKVFRFPSFSSQRSSRCCRERLDVTHVIFLSGVMRRTLKALSEIINDGTKNLMNVLFTYA